ncbi:MAG: polynucleotide adenylyltransferase PcnB [Planctomycetes bacterium]|nr:polynucleotide adenylyltransferase PcnB [Planctomycetota bacterium]
MKSPETTDLVVISPSGLDLNRIDEDALRAVERLQKRGSQAYLVGGCVRDLLLDGQPKDYDIATSARPAQVKRTFSRNCRIIGRRFKLAHLHFDGNRKILEVSTFRRAPEAADESDDDDTDLLITRDNEFGSAEEDAKRRDFTINALFFDPIHDEIIDYVGGLQDVESRVIRTIGDPTIRFREDPVRILRAVKFASRLGLSVDPDTFDAMVAVAPDLKRAAPPRVLEEILRLLRSGFALDAFQLLRDVGALGVILPDIDAFLGESDARDRVLFWRTIEALDARVRTEGAPSAGVMLGALFLQPVLAEARNEPDASLATIAEEVVQPFATDLRVPRRETACLKRVCSVHARFTQRGSGRRFKPSAFAQDPFFDESLEVFALSCAASGEGLDALERWRRIADGSAEPSPRVEQRPRGDSKSNEPRRRKERGKKGKGRAEGGGKKRKRRSERPIEIETLEPEQVDLTAFDIELSPRRAPTFGAIVEGASKKKKRATMSFEEDAYKPPPPPGSSPSEPVAPPPPPPPPSDDEFGDW